MAKHFANEISIQQALLALGHYLRNMNYQFTTITPASHRLVLMRSKKAECFTIEECLRDLFGWNKPVLKNSIPLLVQQLLNQADAVSEIDTHYLQSKVRFSTVNNNLFLHSSYPTFADNAVFLGPDTYRFIRFLKNKINEAKCIVDLGCGPGTAGIVLANLLSQKNTNHVKKVYFSDVNPEALNYTRINIALNNVNNTEVILSNMLEEIPKGADLIVANPPFIMDDEALTYRHGGLNFGSQLSEQMVKAGLDYLAPGGVMALYTGSCIIQGKDVFLEQIQPLLNAYNAYFEYEEIDCDIFGEELKKSSYYEVDRIAAVSLYIKKY